MNASPEFIIAGGGIAGLATALALAKSNRSTCIIERSLGPQTEGAGIQISPNGCRVLDDLGILSDIDEVCVKPVAVRTFDGRSGRHLKDIPLPQDDASRFMVLHRADLLSGLYQKARSEPLISFETGHTVKSAQVEGDHVCVLSQNGADTYTRRAKGLICADGVRSTLRRQIFQKEAEFTGKTAYRALVPLVDAPAWVRHDRTTLVLGKDAHFVLYPLSYRNELNLVFIPNGNADTIPEASYEKWKTPFRRLLSAINNWTPWPIYEVCEPHCFKKDRVAFVGDASHAMVPFLAQGAVMALEDAAQLAHSIGQYDSIDQAFSKYESERKSRVENIARTSQKNGQIYHMAGSMALARNAVMGLSPGKALASRYDWVYDWVPPKISES